jgi:uncharacterized protein
MLPGVRLGDAFLESLAAGPGGFEATRRLAALRRDRHVLLLGWLAPRLEAGARELLATADERDRDAVRSVLAAPLVEAWVSRTVRGLRGSPGSVRPSAADLGHLGGVAIAAALSAGVDGVAAVPLRAGAALIPGVGAVALTGASAGPGDTVRLAVRRGRIRLADAPAAAIALDPLRQVWLPGVGGPWAVGVDDLDPYRGGYHVGPAPRLVPEAFGRWDRQLREAWDLLVAVVPAYAEAARGMLRTLVPLTAEAVRTSTSATLRDAFGAMGLTEPSSSVELASTLIHELQHGKLYATLDLHPMCVEEEPGNGAWFFAPWRTDPRPIGGLLQGAYAFLGVADFWLAVLRAGVPYPAAEREFAAARCQSSLVVRTLAESGRLTSDGVRFVAGLRSKVDELGSAAVAPAIEDAAQAELRRLHLLWSTRHDEIRLRRGHGAA